MIRSFYSVELVKKKKKEKHAVEPTGRLSPVWNRLYGQRIRSQCARRWEPTALPGAKPILMEILVQRRSLQTASKPPSSFTSQDRDNSCIQSVGVHICFILICCIFQNVCILQIPYSTDKDPKSFFQHEEFSECIPEAPRTLQFDPGS